MIFGDPNMEAAALYRILLRVVKFLSPSGKSKKGDFRGIQTDTVCCWWMVGGLH
jgi:hypothetical protein